MQYTVIIEKGPTSYGAYVPDLPACIAVADTEEEVLELIKEAVSFHIELLEEENLSIPQANSKSLLIDI